MKNEKGEYSFLVSNKFCFNGLESNMNDDIVVFRLNKLNNLISNCFFWSFDQILQKIENAFFLNLSVYD